VEITPLPLEVMPAAPVMVDPTIEIAMPVSDEGHGAPVRRVRTRSRREAAPAPETMVAVVDAPQDPPLQQADDEGAEPRRRRRRSSAAE
jgi:hypothetical protein